MSHGGDLNGPIALIDLAKGRFNPDAITNSQTRISVYQNIWSAGRTNLHKKIKDGQWSCML